MTFYQSVYRYSCFAKLCGFSLKKKLVQSSYEISFFRLCEKPSNSKEKLEKMTANQASSWNQWWTKCTTQQNRMLPLSSCICKSLIRQVFNRPRKLNVESVLLALLFICPCINRQLWDRTVTQRFGLSE